MPKFMQGHGANAHKLVVSLCDYSTLLGVIDMTSINNAQDVLDFFGAESMEAAKRHAYKYTDCGVWLNFLDDGIQLGSIVEGSDAEVTTDPLRYPFTPKELQDTIDYIEDEVSLLWWEANNDADDDCDD